MGRLLLLYVTNINPQFKNNTSVELDSALVFYVNIIDPINPLSHRLLHSSSLLPTTHIVCTCNFALHIWY